MSKLLDFLRTQFCSLADLAADVLRQKLPPIASVWPENIRLDAQSGQTHAGALWFTVRADGVRWLAVIGPAPAFDGLEGERVELGASLNLGVFALNPSNAQVLRQHFKWLNPVPYGLKPTFGCGDRLGLATPGHIHAARACGVNVVLAQQSIREMARTGRTPRQVMDDAMWGVFQTGYTVGFGADADHLKTFQDIEVTAAAGFTMFTIDPSEYVDRTADAATEAELDAKLETINAKALPVLVPELMSLYAFKGFAIPAAGRITPKPLEVKRAIVKYGRAIAHTERMARQIAKVVGQRPYDLEMSVDETDQPTTAVEHLFVGQELRRRGIKVHSLALRFIGEFQKGIDYIGDLKLFEEDFARQVAIAKFCGPYKMSIHSGSDKFSIFPIIGRLTGPLVHEKTAGTSYLEALRVVARTQPGLFREICLFALERYPKDRATYHVAEKPDQLPDLRSLADGDLEKLLENNHGRQLLHVTFGSVLNEKKADGTLRFKDRLDQTLCENEELYARILESHFSRHMRALGMATQPAA